MKNKKLIALLAIVVILLIIGIVTKKRPDTSIVKTVGLEKIIPSELNIKTINRIEIQIPDDPDKKDIEQLENNVNRTIILEKRGDNWFLPNTFNARAAKDRVEDFIPLLTEIEGEFRSDSGEILTDYGLEEEKAMKISVYREGDKKGTTLLVGKTADMNTHFVREKGSSRVFSIDRDIRNRVGASTSDVYKPPDYKKFVDLKLFDLDLKEIKEINISFSDLIAYKLTKETIKHTSIEDIPDEGGKEKKKEREEGPPRGIIQWVVTLPDLPFSLKEDGVENLIDKINTVYAEDITGVKGNDLKDKFGFSDLLMKLLYSTTKEEDIVVTIGKLDPSKDNYYLKKTDSENVFTISRSDAEKIFLKNNDVFALGVLKLTKTDISEISLKGKEAFNIKRDSEADTLYIEKAGKKEATEESMINDIVDEYSNMDAYGFITKSVSINDPQHQAIISLKDGNIYTVKIGDSIEGFDSVFIAEISSLKQQILLDKFTVEKLFPELP